MLLYSHNHLFHHLYYTQIEWLRLGMQIYSMVCRERWSRCCNYWRDSWWVSVKRKQIIKKERIVSCPRIHGWMTFMYTKISLDLVVFAMSVSLCYVNVFCYVSVFGFSIQLCLFLLYKCILVKSTCTCPKHMKWIEKATFTKLSKLGHQCRNAMM